MKKLTTEEFIEKAKEIHGNNYSYEKTKYKGTHIKAIFMCKKHGEFEAEPNNHLRTGGCPKCRREKQVSKIRYTQQIFITKAKERHGDNYSYEKIKYINSKTKVCIICNNCGREFWQTPKAHLQGKNCPFCFKESKGEKTIRLFLEQRNIEYEQNKWFDDFGDKENLARKPTFDFYIKDKNLLIEYNGEQHYKPVEKFGGEEKFKRQQLSDKRKEEYARNNKIRLLTISYKDYKNIDKILEEKLG